MHTQKRQLKRTVSVEGIIEQSGARWLPEDQEPKRAIACFRKWPIDIVRAACLEVMGRSFRRFEYIDWARETIEDLIEVRDERMAAEVFECYTDAISRTLEHHVSEYIKYRNHVSWKCSLKERLEEYHPEVWPALVRASAFVIDIGSNNPRLMPRAVKAVCGYMRENHELYLQTTTLREFMANALSLVELKGYEESEWHSAQRVLHLIVLENDQSFHEQIVSLIRLHEQGEALPSSGGPFAKAANLGVLREASRILVQLANASA